MHHDNACVFEFYKIIHNERSDINVLFYVAYEMTVLSTFVCIAQEQRTAARRKCLRKLEPFCAWLNLFRLTPSPIFYMLAQLLSYFCLGGWVTVSDNRNANDSRSR